jgi:hypothetical protein
MQIPIVADTTKVCSEEQQPQKQEQEQLGGWSRSRSNRISSSSTAL